MPNFSLVVDDAITSDMLVSKVLKSEHEDFSQLVDFG